jgi:hypothetical protein
MALISRVPEVLEQTVTPEQAWEEESGELQPSRASALSVGQGWQSDSLNFLQPTDSASLTDDDFWELDGNGDLQPQA